MIHSNAERCVSNEQHGYYCRVLFWSRLSVYNIIPSVGNSRGNGTSGYGLSILRKIVPTAISSPFVNEIELLLRNRNQQNFQGSNSFCLLFFFLSFFFETFFATSKKKRGTCIYAKEANGIYFEISNPTDESISYGFSSTMT